MGSRTTGNCLVKADPVTQGTDKKGHLQMQALEMICLQHYFCKRSNLYPTNCTEFPSRALAENPFHYLPTSLGVDEPLTSSLEVQCSDPHLCYQKTFSLISMKMVTQFSKPFSTMTPEFSLKNKQANQKTSCV